MQMYILYGALALLILSLIWQVRTEMRLKKLMTGKDGKSLEGAITSLVEAVQNIEKREDDIVAMLSHVDERVKGSIRGVELIRFNPFEDSGSNQSFAIALLSENGDGIVLSSLYSRERMSVFAKPIKSHKSSFELTTEEKEVLGKASIKS